MVETRLIALTASVLLLCSCEYTYTWEKHRMDGRRTGVTAPNAENVSQALGTVSDSSYLAPNGTVWEQGVAEDRCKTLLDRFFRDRRSEGESI